MRSHHLTEFEKLYRSRLFWAMIIAVIVLAFTAGSAVGIAGQQKDTQTAEEKADTGAEPIETTEVVVSEQDETVTMAIDLEEGGIIDLDMTRGDVVIDTYDGSDVLVIVEKKLKRGTAGSAEPRHINFKVSRLGNNVRIAALDDQGRRVTDVDFSFRIMVPKDRDTKRVDEQYDLAKLTSTIFRALHREALDWLTR